MKKKEIRFKIPNCDTLEIYKQVRSRFWYARFYVGLHLNKSGNHIKSTKTESQQEAIKVAKEMWRDYFFINPKEKDVLIEMTFNTIAQSYFEHEKFTIDNTAFKDEYFKKSNRQKDYESNLKRYERLKETFGGKDINSISTKMIERFYIKMKSVFTLSTVGKHLTLLKQILEYARDDDVIRSLPKFPKIIRSNDSSYQPYTLKEVNEITKMLRTLSAVMPSKRSSLSSYEHYNEVADIVNFLTHTLIRPGKELYMIKHKHFELMTNTKNEEFYLITPPHRKVNSKNDGPIPTDNIVKDIYENRISKRYPKETGEEYIFFNNNADREQVRNTVDKVFRKVSKMLNLYYIEGSTRNRPLYSLRPTSAIETHEHTGASLDDIARLGNTSVKMLDTRYMRKYQKEKAIQIQERIYSKKK